MNPNYSETPRTDLAEENLRALGGAGYVPSSFARELERELIVKSANYALAHENLGREVVKCGQLTNDNKNLMRELAEKNETANVFMAQVKKLQSALEKARHQLLDRCGIDKDSDNAVALEINKVLAEPANIRS